MAMMRLRRRQSPATNYRFPGVLTILLMSDVGRCEETFGDFKAGVASRLTGLRGPGRLMAALILPL